MTLNIPNMLTLFRIAMIPLFVWIFYLPDHMLAPFWVNFDATVIFALAAITDWLDGYLARRLNQTSAFGAFLDPVADKLMVVAALVVLVELGRVGAVVALIIIGREIAISALREWMSGVGAGSSVAVATIGKVKTAAQMIAIPFLLYFQPISLFGARLDVAKVGTLLIYIAALLTLVSMAYYLRAARKQLRP
ncbi:MAG TPA: CDP-diacylglycerol--glycerol-3-phosphate 3-phosphatidyltransferase [Methylophilaceae bacterium]|jgi:CDP-diacylglycerol--glycerol-3-phosphate 3-phosphatidyltransferase/cardiolipin synthase